MELSKSYEPADLEARWAQRWLDSGAFTADPDSGKPPFVIVIPPPNVTGSLHMGHALTNTIQDMMCRFRRMRQHEVLWLPGTDHAGIATQMVVEREIARDGLTRQELGRDAFIERVWAWKEQYGGRIRLQTQRMGASVDWSRERFTMDPGLSRAVREVFVTLHEQGLVYRDDRLVNWDPVSHTVLSDLEVEQEEEDGFLWHIAYPVVGTDERLVVATTRPETLLGDTAVAIHPDDERYRHLHGLHVALPLTDRTIPIVCDPEAADPTFGSGAVKVTPAHDFNDFETGRRNGLPSLQVIDLSARMNDNCPERFRGLDRYEARKRIVAELRELGLLVQEQPYRFTPGRSQRSGAIVEPLSVGKQWYVRMKPLAEPAIEAVRDGRIRFLPEHWEKTYFHWMENIRDWCISRQLWWGHRVPAWTCDSCGHLMVERHDPTACSACGHTVLHQDEDVLDTWFSSGLWPFSTLGWPDRTPDLRTFYPTSVMETGFDIIFFWVARMIMFGMHFMEDVPFRTVFLHAMVRDRNGQKMSKTKGNVIDPLHLIDGMKPDQLTEREREMSQQLLAEFPDGLEPQGADALRFTLAMYAAAGRDIKLDVSRVEGYRAFINKLWNATRFVLMNLEDARVERFEPAALTLSPADRWILDKLHEATAQTTEHLEQFRFSDAAHTMYTFVWHHFCDWYIELSKPILYNAEGDFPGERASTQAVMAHVLDQVLRLLHPFIPFVTEELWAALPQRTGRDELLAVADWPDAATIPTDAATSASIDTLIAVITGVRRVRAESAVPPGRDLPQVMLLSDRAETRAALDQMAGYIRRLARVEAIVTGTTDTERPSQAGTAVEAGVEIVVPLEGLIDVEAEIARIEQAIDKANTDIGFFEKKLNNPKFVANAKPEIVAQDRAKLAAAQEKRATLLAGLARLKDQ